jgi:hypothetical protein
MPPGIKQEPDEEGGEGEGVKVKKAKKKKKKCGTSKNGIKKSRKVKVEGMDVIHHQMEGARSPSRGCKLIVS